MVVGVRVMGLVWLAGVGVVGWDTIIQVLIKIFDFVWASVSYAALLHETFILQETSATSTSWDHPPWERPMEYAHCGAPLNGVESPLVTVGIGCSKEAHEGQLLSFTLNGVSPFLIGFGHPG